MSQNWEIKLRFEKALEKYAGNMEELEKINQIRNMVYTDSERTLFNFRKISD